LHNLPPFPTRRSSDLQWSDPYTLLRIEIAPPIWKTPLAYVSYILLLVASLLLIRHIERKRQKSRFRLQQEREAFKQSIELDRTRSEEHTSELQSRENL